MGSEAPRIREADALVIGAGAFGLSTAFHLAKLGVRNVVLVERFAPGTQTSPRAAGLFKQIQADEMRTRLACLSIDKMLRFEEETGIPLSVPECGSLLIGRTPAHAEMIREEATRSAQWGIELEMVDGVEAHRLAPYLETPDIQAACWIPGDIYIEEPSTLLDAYLQAAQKVGVQVLDHTPVTGIKLSDGRVEAVVTERGEIRTPIVVDAAGPWAGLVGRMAGARVAVVPVRHQLAITEPVAGIESNHPIVRIADASAYVRPARRGLMVGGFEAEPLPVDLQDRPDFSTTDVPLDETVLRNFAGRIGRQIPWLEDAPFQELRGGLPTLTGDGKFIAGPIPEVHGFWAVTGCNVSGFSFAPALGQVIAEWIVDGKPSIDLDALNPGRFASPGFDEDRLREQSIWHYANYYTPLSASDQ